jgi:superkiller protein 3
VGEGRAEAALALCRGAAARAPDAVWPVKRSGEMAHSIHCACCPVKQVAAWVRRTPPPPHAAAQLRRSHPPRRLRPSLPPSLPLFGLPLFLPFTPCAAYLLLARGDHADAIAAFQAALRAAPGDAAAWEGLAAAYQPLGRLTAALKAYQRALEIDPGRVYSLVQSGGLHLALGAPGEALRCQEGALAIDPGHPAALLGAAEALAAAAAAHACAAALDAASGELRAAAGYAGRCAAARPSLAAAWKQLGDVLILHHAVTPLPEPSNIPSSAAAAAGPSPDGGAQEALQGWRRRVGAVRRARAAYAKALHLHPAQAGAWQDAGATFYLERQLRRAHPGVKDCGAPAHGGAAQTLEALAAAAERSLRGALRLDPGSAALWAALGAAAPSPAAREYALARALQLDRKLSAAWVALARLYIDAGLAPLAERCLAAARSQDPAVGAVWEGMGAAAALRAGPLAERERAEFNEHALGLGAAAEGQLGFAEAAARAGRGGEGRAHAAAARAAALAPLDPAARNAWGLALEARGDAVRAVGQYRAALELLQSVAAPPAPPGGAAAACALRQPAAARGGAPLATAVRLNLARALARAGLHSEATLLYGEMEYLEELEGEAAAWLSYAHARRATGDASGAAYAAGAALAAAEGDAALSAAAVEALMQLGPPGEAPAQLRRNLPVLRALCWAPQSAVARLWLVAAAAAAVAQDAALVRETAAEARDWAAQADHEEAAFLAELLGLGGAAAAAAGDAAGAARAYAAAVHARPSYAGLRVALAGACLLAGPARAAAARGMVGSPLRGAAAGGAAADAAAPVAPAGAGLVDAALQAAATADLARCLPAAKRQLRQDLAAAAAAVHASPGAAGRWHLGAVLATQAASAAPSAAAFRRALAWCRAARAALRLEPGPGGAARRARIEVCASECLLHHRGGGGGGASLEAAAAAAAAALELARASGSAAEQAAAHRQVARCHWAAGGAEAAERACRAAMGVAAGADARAAGAAELASLLEASGRGDAAAQVLADEAVGAEPLRRQQLLLQRTLLLLRLGRPDAAREASNAAAVAVAEAATAGGGSSVQALLLAQGAVALSQAQAQAAGGASASANEASGAAALLGEARRALSESLQAGGARGEGVAARALLAQAEAAGGLRRREERAAAHAAAALRRAPRPVPSDLLGVLGQATGSRRLCARAVHAAPWSGAARARLAGDAP